MDEKVVFSTIKETIIAQNRAFLLDLSKRFKLDYEYLCEKYIRPEYYLPIVAWQSAATGASGSAGKGV